MDLPAGYSLALPASGPRAGRSKTRGATIVAMCVICLGGVNIQKISATVILFLDPHAPLLLTRLTGMPRGVPRTDRSLS